MLLEAMLFKHNPSACLYFIRGILSWRVQFMTQFGVNISETFEPKSAFPSITGNKHVEQ